MEPKTFINPPEDLLSWRVNINYVHAPIYGKLLKISSDYKSYDKTSELLPTPVMDPRSKGLCLDTISPCQQKPVRRGGRRRNPNWVFFKNLPNPITATRYHSLVLNRKTLPECFEITAESDDNEIMGIRHKQLPVEGIQFHPESILTPNGKDLLKNFIEGN